MSEDEGKRQELLAFGKSEKKDVTPTLMSVIHDMCDTGVPVFEWSHLKPLVIHLVLETVKKFEEEQKEKDKDKVVDESESKATKAHCEYIVKCLEEFDSAPFTLQRICELITQPSLHYKKANKLLYGIEKLVSVSSTLEPAAPEDLKRLSEEMKVAVANKKTFPQTNKPQEEKPSGGEAAETEAKTEKKKEQDNDGDTEMKDASSSPAK